MKNIIKSAARSVFYSRALIGFVLCLASLLLAFAGLSKSGIEMIRHEAPAQPDRSAAESPKANAYATTQLTYKIIAAPKHTWCYDVFADGKLMIHQTSVPALSGDEGFKTREDATKVALLVIEKIKKHEMPPTLSIDEMKQLGAIK